MKTEQSKWKVRVGVWLVVVVVGDGWACSRNSPPATSEGQSPAVSSPATPPAIPSHAAPAGRLTYQAPSGWVSETPTSSMRVAQYQLPRAEGDPEDASLVVYYFGAGQGGSVEANLVRWTNRMEQPDGRPSSEKATTEKMTVNGLNVTVLDVTGTYWAEMMPGQGERLNKPNFRMRAVVVETPAGPYFFKLVGPEKTVQRWDDSFMEFIKSSQYK